MLEIAVTAPSNYTLSAERKSEKEHIGQSYTVWKKDKILVDGTLSVISNCKNSYVISLFKGIEEVKKLSIDERSDLNTCSNLL